MIKASLEVASGTPLKLFRKEGYYLKKLFGWWDRSWKLLVPGLPIGLLLYFNKRWHKVSPVIAFPPEFTDEKGEVHLPLQWFWATFSAMD